MDHDSDPPVSEVSPELQFGEMVGEYRIQGKIGEGSFGHVYRAVHPVIGKNAAVKVLHKQFSSSPEFVQRFIEEARAANKIRHRGIIDIFGFGALPDGRQYYVMEMLEGMTLDAYLQTKGQLEAVEALPILRGVARAIDAAHAAGIVHRDLKPDNVFLVLDEDQIPKPKVLDFGIAKLLGDHATGPKKTGVGAILGTPHYMSPEQCKGAEIDKAADVYAFGVMTFEILTGQMPFNGTSALELMMQHVGHDPPKPSSVNPNLSAKVDASILLMLSKDPKQRPASLAQAVEELARASGFTWQLTGPRTQSVPPLVRRHSAGQMPAVNPGGAGTPAPAIIVKPSDTPTARSADSVQAVGISQLPPTQASGGSRTGLFVAIAIALTLFGGGLYFFLGPPSAPLGVPKGATAAALPPPPAASATGTPAAVDSTPKTAEPAVSAIASASASTSASSAKPTTAPGNHPALPAQNGPSPKAAKPRTNELPESPY